MTTQISLALKGDLERWAKQETRAAEIAVTSVVKSRTRLVRNAVRRQIRRAGFERRAFGASLESTIKGKVYPERGRSINAAGRVESKAVYRRRGGDVDLVTVFSEGATVRGGQYLAVPTENAPWRSGRAGNAKASPTSDAAAGIRTGIFSAGDGVFAVYQKGKRDARGRPLVLWWLVRQVRLTRRLDPERELERLTRNIDDLLARRWEREAQKRGVAEIDF